MPTRSQEMMKMAADHVTAVKEQEQDRAANDRPIAKKYGSLCHQLPVLVRTCGLCQAVAFLESKAAGHDAESQSHGLVLRHMRSVMDTNGISLAGNVLSKAISTVPTQEYIHATRTILQSWVYYKRFGESILGVDAGETRRKR